MMKRWYTVMYVEGFDPGPHGGASWSGDYKHIQAKSAGRAARIVEDAEPGLEVFAVFEGLLYPTDTRLGELGNAQPEYSA